MSKPVKPERITKFHEDRAILGHYNDIDIASRMGVDKSTYSNCVNGHRTITNHFLKKFYVAYGKEIDEKRREGSREEGGTYTKPGDIIETLLKNDKEQEGKLDRLTESHQKIFEEFHRLEDKMNKVLGAKLDQIAAQLSRLIIQKKKAAKKSSGKNSKKSSPP